MSDKLKFKDEEIKSETTETTEKTAETPVNNPLRLTFKDDPLEADPPTDGVTPMNDPAAEHYGGGETTEAVEDDIGNIETTAHDADTEQSSHADTAFG